jgi:catechol 2,3-dioxygenase-like lactoylglutathione lyase family enzyme
MKKILLLSIIALISNFSLKSQDFGTSVDHYAIRVADLEASTKFYTDVLALKVIDNPTGNPDIRWFSLGDGLALHVIQGDVSKLSLNKSVHLALAMTALDSFIASLKTKNIPYSDWPGTNDAVSIRPDGVRQIYIQDPDGYWIEINDNGIKKNKKSKK